MPTYRSINVALHSQFDIESLPEYYTPPHQHPPSTSQARGASAISPLVDDTTSTCSVYIPVLPGSQFWIAYSVSPPVPEGHYFLFKLFVDGIAVVSWSTGREEGWEGKCVFGLFEDDGDGVGNMRRGRVGKRVFCFSALRKDEGTGTEDMFDESKRIEIRVHRASGRKRVEREMEVFEQTALAKKAEGIRQVHPLQERSG